MKVVSVINYKGGVGKTTLTANLGAYAASEGRRVLMIDLDPQASLTFSFMSPEKWRDLYADNMTMKNYFDSIANESKIIPSLLSIAIPLDLGDPLKVSGMKADLISSHLEVINADIDIASRIIVSNDAALMSSSLKIFSYLRNSLSELQDSYDLVLIDCPPNFNAVVKNALFASDYYIVPAKLDYLSTLGISQLNRSVNENLEKYNRYVEMRADNDYDPSSLKMLGIVPMMVTILKDGSRDKSKEREIIATQQEFLTGLTEKGHYIFTPVRNNSTVFGAAPVDGIPVILTHPKFYSQTARKIVRELQELGAEFLSRLKI